MLPDARDFCPNSSCSITVAFSPNIRLICSVISFRVYSNAPEPGIRRDKTHFFFVWVCSVAFYARLFFAIALFCCAFFRWSGLCSFLFHILPWISRSIFFFQHILPTFPWIVFHTCSLMYFILHSRLSPFL